MRTIINYITFLLCLSLISSTLWAKKIKSIKREEIHHIKFKYDANTLKIPGNSFKIGLSAINYFGEEFNTKGYLDGNIRWLNYKIHTDGGSYFTGKIYVDHQPGYLKGKSIEVQIKSRHHNDIKLARNVHLNYEVDIFLKPTSQIIASPGRCFSVGVITEFDNGMYIKSTYNCPFTYSLNNYYIYSEQGFIRNNRFYISPDIFDFVDHKVEVTAELKVNPEIRDTINFLLDYRHNYSKYFYARDGFSGSGGSDGSSGSSGGNGRNGSCGQHGQHGEDGPDLAVFVDVYYDDILHCDLLKVRVNENYAAFCTRYLVNPDGGSIKIHSHGGDGGNGGDGGDGGRGGNGYNGPIYYVQEKVNDSTYVQVKKQGRAGNGGNGGDGGNGGCGGDGGRGGDIYLYFTENAKQYSNLIVPVSEPGSGGSGGSGGTSGSGGRGGDGSPDGNSGRSGSWGSSGWNGSRGNYGRISYHTLDEFYW